MEFNNIQRKLIPKKQNETNFIPQENHLRLYFALENDLVQKTVALFPPRKAQYFSNQNEMPEAGFSKYLCFPKQFVPYSKRNRAMKTKR